MSLWPFSNRERRADAPTEDETAGSGVFDEDVLLEALLNGTKLDAEMAMEIPAVASAVNRIASLVAVLPVKLYEKVPIDKDGNKVDIKDAARFKVVEVIADNRNHLLNVEAGDTLNTFNIKRNIAKDYLLDKGGFLYVDKSGINYRRLAYIPPSDITSIVNDTNPINKIGRYLVQGMQFADYEIVAVLRDTNDGFLGKPLVKQINDTLDTALTNIMYELGIVRKGGTKKGFLQAASKLDPKALKTLKAAWRRLYTNNTENVVILNKGVEFNAASDNPREMQVNERKKTMFNEIQEIFGIKEGAAFEDFFRDAVLPVLEAFEAGLNKTMLLEDEKQNRFFSIDKREVLKASLEARYKSYDVASKVGLLTKNEMRELEGLEPIAGLNIMSMNLSDVIFNTETKEFFTPNTGNSKAFEDKASANGTDSDIIDENTEGEK